MPTCPECDHEFDDDGDLSCLVAEAVSDEEYRWKLDVWRHIEPLAAHLRADGRRLNSLDDFLQACDEQAVGVYVKPRARGIGQ